jgi:hypothetical protein
MIRIDRISIAVIHPVDPFDPVILSIKIALALGID